MNDIKNIAITFQNLVQFYSMKHGIDALIAKGYPVDIYVPINNDDSGVGDMFTETYDKLINMGYSPIRELDPSKHYKILLEPYPMDIYYKFNFKYRIKYKYAPISAKPNLTLNPENNIFYDCILCYGNYESNYLRVYSNTKLIDYLKYINFKKSEVNSNKKVLLYLPTYGDSSSIDNIIDSLALLKDDYYIITKFHHGTSFLKSELYRIDKLKSISDEYYDHSTSLEQLLQKVQIVLSDNSGSIFEALYSKTPVAVFCSDPNKNKIDNFNTTQYKLIQKGYIPYTNDPLKIKSVLEQALTQDIINKQTDLSNSLFFHSDNPVENFVSIIESYLTDNIDTDYKNMHDVLLNNYISKINTINDYKNQYDILLSDYNNNKNIINDLSEKNTSLNELHNQKDNEIENLKKNEIEDLKEKEILNDKIHDLEEKIQELEKQVSFQSKTISFYENGKLYKVSKKIYILYYKLFKKKE